jgi:hypothetical protein
LFVAPLRRVAYTYQEKTKGTNWPANGEELLFAPCDIGGSENRSQVTQVCIYTDTNGRPAIFTCKQHCLKQVCPCILQHLTPGVPVWGPLGRTRTPMRVLL